MGEHRLDNCESFCSIYVFLIFRVDLRASFWLFSFRVREVVKLKTIIKECPKIKVGKLVGVHRRL